MKTRTQITLLFLLFCISTISCSSEGEKQLQINLENNFKSADFVASVDILSVKETDKIGDEKKGGYYSAIVEADIIEIFKGDYDKNLKIYYSTSGELPFKPDILKHKSMVFLVKHLDKNENKIKYYNIENSTVHLSNEVMSMINKISKR